MQEGQHLLDEPKFTPEKPSQWKCETAEVNWPIKRTESYLDERTEVDDLTLWRIQEANRWKTRDHRSVHADTRINFVVELELLSTKWVEIYRYSITKEKVV